MRGRVRLYIRLWDLVRIRIRGRGYMRSIRGLSVVVSVRPSRFCVLGLGVCGIFSLFSSFKSHVIPFFFSFPSSLFLFLSLASWVCTYLCSIKHFFLAVFVFFLLHSLTNMIRLKTGYRDILLVYTDTQTCLPPSTLIFSSYTFRPRAIGVLPSPIPTYIRE